LLNAEKKERAMKGTGVLIVEDDWLIGEMIADRIERLGHEAIGPAPSVAEALELLRRGLPRLALLDVNLGSETSFPIADALAREQVPFGFVTSYEQDQLPERFADRPFLRKPFDPRHLDEEVHMLADAAHA
jgi:DNA-binding response OmpR family regulator